MRYFWMALIFATLSLTQTGLAAAQSVEPPRRPDGMRPNVTRTDSRVEEHAAPLGPPNAANFEKIDQELQTLQKSIESIQKNASARQEAPLAKPKDAPSTPAPAAAAAASPPDGSSNRPAPQFFDFSNSKSPTQTLVLLLVSGIMGMVGQGARTIVGLKKLSDKSRTAAGAANEFSASRLAVGLMIGFVAGVAGGLTPKVFDASAITSDTLFYLASIGYMGVDVIEGFMNTVASGHLPKALPEAIVGAPSAQHVAETSPTEAPTPTSHQLASTRPPPPPSPHVANEEIREALQYAEEVAAASQKQGIPEEYIYGIGSRESVWGLALHPKGPAGAGDWAPRNGRMPPDGLGWGRGLLQIDYASHPFAQTGDWRDPSANIAYGSDLLGQNLDYFRRANHPGIDPLRAAIAAYNCGVGNVERAIQEGEDVDARTTGRNYSADVIRRAGIYKPYISSAPVA